jgi:hypothetical protein
LSSYFFSVFASQHHVSAERFFLFSKERFTRCAFSQSDLLIFSKQNCCCLIAKAKQEKFKAVESVPSLVPPPPSKRKQKNNNQMPYRKSRLNPQVKVRLFAWMYTK